MTALLTLMASTASAEVLPSPGPRLVELRMLACAAGSPAADRFSQLLAIELAVGNDQLVRTDSIPSPALTVEIDSAICDPGAREIGVTLVEPSSGARHRHLIAVHDVEERARPRAFALAVAELVLASREKAGDDLPVTSEMGAASRAQSTSPPMPARAAEVSPPTPAAATIDDGLPRFQGDVDAAASVRLFAPASTTLVGASLAAGLALRPRWLVMRADVDVHASTVSDPLGEIDLTLYAAGVALLARRGRFPEFSAGPRLEVGYLRAVGLASDPSRSASQDGHVTALLSLTAGARFWFGRWAAFADVDLGAAVAGAEIYAGDRRAAAVDGAFVGARAGLAFGY